MKTNFIVLLAVFFIIEIYVYQAIRNITTNNYIRIGYWVFTLLAYGIILYWILTFNRASRDHQQIQLMVSAVMIFVFPKILSLIFLLIGDFSRFLEFGFKYFTANENYFPERRKFISTTALAVAGIFSALAIDGIIFGKYRHSVRKVKLRFKNLPESFKGYKIVQISDVHSGSFFNPQKLQKAINLINEQEADVVLFTGDMVNNYADEFKPFIPLFKSIKAKDGKFSILGNHDYGDYGAWNSAEEKAQNIPNLKNYQAEAGFKLLRNENIALEKNGEKIYLLGLENWGIKPFPQYGDLDKALTGVPEEAIKVLMSHDPTHFDEVVKKHKTNVNLTLSGHTHGMQFGLDLKNIKWSPVKFKYKKWADLYESEGKYLYVNRGFGVIAYPGRVGINPEITVIELV
ncbi:metallophosphoesterase [Cloacibacterium sp. TD35]|uniref:metallophosphoesterase n=1 Tax=Cloacibacterium sp. TD35 TaxID=2976818 RepID=UPI00237DAE3B|nr:metallophosphoesterase [Cloacibacterium sp. TD35]WDT67680.1 metallophosphoesterase [Cloacibacterium sp. TD35]